MYIRFLLAIKSPDFFTQEILLLIPLFTSPPSPNAYVFPSDDSVFKTLYLTIDYITRKWSMPIQNWGEAMAHFLIKFEGRI